jgi:hypothetical protein
VYARRVEHQKQHSKRVLEVCLAQGLVRPAALGVLTLTSNALLRLAVPGRAHAEVDLDIAS